MKQKKFIVLSVILSINVLIPTFKSSITYADEMYNDTYEEISHEDTYNKRQKK